VASFNADSLLSMGNIPISPALDSCWLESPGESLYASSLSGHLDRFDLLTGRLLASAERRNVQWTGMTFLQNDLLALFTDPSNGMSNVEVLDPSTLQSRGLFLDAPVATATCWLETALDSVYASSPAGDLLRFGTSGQLLEGISEPGVAWAGLAFADGRLFAAFTDKSGNSGGIRMFAAGSLRDLGNFLTFPPGHGAGPFELRPVNNSIYASFLDGTIDRYDLSGNLLASVNSPGLELRGLAIAPAAVPEPAACLLLLMAGVLLTGDRFRRAPGNPVPWPGGEF
jgi:hypothetical protein